MLHTRALFASCTLSVLIWSSLFLLFCLLQRLSCSCSCLFSLFCLLFLLSFSYPLVRCLCFCVVLARICVTLVSYGRFGGSDCRRSLVCWGFMSCISHYSLELCLRIRFSYCKSRDFVTQLEVCDRLRLAAGSPSLGRLMWPFCFLCLFVLFFSSSLSFSFSLSLSVSLAPSASEKHQHRESEYTAC